MVQKWDSQNIPLNYEKQVVIVPLNDINLA